jgi:hypothetical protein
MRHPFRNLAVGTLLVGMAACADLDVANPNDADAARSLSTADDVVSLISGSYNTWFSGSYSTSGPGAFLSNASFQHTAPWANFGMEFYGRIPRQPIVNDAADSYYGNVTRAWYYSYRAIAAVSDGLRALDDPAIAEGLDAEEITQARAFGTFVLGLAHATVATLYDQGFVVDQTVDISQPQEALGHLALMDAALGYFDEAISLSSGAGFTLPEGWMQATVTADDLVRIAHSMKARYRAAAARTPAERQAVDWNAVIADVDAGITSDFVQNMDANNGWYFSVLDYGTFPGWSESPYWIYGMADQSGNYQDWLALSVADKHPDVSGNPTLIITPDLRFPQGATWEAQQANPGIYYHSPIDITDVWARPDRGTWRWSYYKDERYENYYTWTDFHHNEIDVTEMRLLEAEAEYWNGNLGAAADLINVTRTAAGLNATDAAGTNTSCVPKLPDGSCGDLLEMLKWEKRIEVNFEGLFGAPWYFDSRGWGDLWIGTALTFPVPCRELQVLGMLPCYSFGGSSGEMASPGSSYSWPHEN